jgi:hypothetical protein
MISGGVPFGVHLAASNSEKPTSKAKPAVQFDLKSLNSDLFTGGIIKNRPVPRLPLILFFLPS